MSVHHALTEHAKKINNRITRFLELDATREAYIEEALNLCKEGKPFSTEKINQVTEEINQLARQGNIPSRKLVTTVMVEEYADRMK
ncbi:YpbS family protein [Bacillus infantis]|uniref:YpbS family protein n=1 Tax=Bacillus infantis TaxID=324767 RepID=UPI002005DBE9|nr:YpbS family protein [Bacillus infantis]MCK6205244.1 YpbS family protein [Bacillus infantis]